MDVNSRFLIKIIILNYKILQNKYTKTRENGIKNNIFLYAI